MSWNDLIYGLGEFFWKTFEILPVLGNNFNYLLMVVGSAAALYWIMQLVKFSGQAKDNPAAE